MVWLLLFHWLRLSVFTNSTGTSRLTTWTLCRMVCIVKFGSHPTLLSIIHRTPPATSPGCTTSARHLCHQWTLPMISKIISLFIVVQLILTFHLMISMTLMTMSNGKTKPTMMLHGAQNGIQLTSSSPLMEPMLPTPLPLNLQFTPLVVMDQD